MTDLSGIDKYVKSPSPDPIKKKPVAHPTGWEPGVDTARGVIVAPPTTDGVPPEDWSEILEEFRLDPAKWEIVSDSVNVRTWDTNTGGGVIKRLFYFRADIRPRVAREDADLQALMKRISKHRYRRKSSVGGTVDATSLTSARVVCLADWQAGPDPEGLVNLVLQLKNDVVDLLKEEKPEALYVIGMGDMIEGCDGHYDMQTFLTGRGGLNGRRGQSTLVRRLLVELLTTWARYVDRVIVGCVPGNHGENRKKGKAFTTFEDNEDLGVFEEAAEALALNPEAYGHVRFVIPDGDMSLTLDIAGTVVGFIHGHQATKGVTPRQRLDAWWAGKQKARHQIGDADLLVAGHLHHLIVVQDGPRTMMQCPSLAQSRWFTEIGGSETKVGTLTFAITPGGWDHLRVL